MAKEDVWVVSLMDVSGFAYSSIAKNRDDAVSSFMSYVYMLVHAFPEADFRIVGKDEDAATGLHCLMRIEEKWVYVISMISPGVIEPQPGVTAFSWQGSRFVEIATDIEGVVKKHQVEISTEEKNRLSRSIVAVLFPRDGTEVLLNSAQQDPKPGPVSAARASEVWNAMGQVKQFISHMAVVRSL